MNSFLNLFIVTQRIRPYHQTIYKSLSHQNNINIEVIHLKPKSNSYLWGDLKDLIYKFLNIKNCSSYKDIKNQTYELLEISKTKIQKYNLNKLAEGLKTSLKSIQYMKFYKISQITSVIIIFFL